MIGAGKRYALDSNVFIRGFREPEYNTVLQSFHAAFAPFEHLSAVVAFELRSGARSRAAATQLQRTVFAVNSRRPGVSRQLLQRSIGREDVWEGCSSSPGLSLPSKVLQDQLLTNGYSPA